MRPLWESSAAVRGIGAQLRREAHLIQQHRRFVPGRPPRDALQVQRQRHVLQRRQRREQVERLKDEADALAANRGQVALREACHLVSEQVQRS
jgi:hypothetical protein